MKTKLFLGLLVLSVFLISCKSDNSLKCNSVQTDNAKDSCYLNLALQNKNIDLCANAPNSKSCYQGYWHELRDLELCNKVSSQLKWECVYDIETSKGYKICTNLLNMADKEKCFAATKKTKKDASSCDQIDDNYYKDKCLSEAGGDNDNIAICDRITTQSIKDECYFKIGVMNQDSKICDAARNETIQEKCILGVASRKNDTEMCNQLQEK